LTFGQDRNFRVVAMQPLGGEHIGFDQLEERHDGKDASANLIEALERLSTRIARSKRRLDPATLNRQVGRILQQNQRAAARFKIKLEPHGSPAGLRLSVAYDAAFDDWAALSEGAYLLRSNIEDWSDRQLWKAYIQLTQAEAAFRYPERSGERQADQRQDRVEAHILVCFLAFVL
jgi:hypothetical protein